MRHVVFRTPELIDIRAFTVMGLSSKPDSDAPIGKFGTGLKMAIAVLVRNDIRVVLWIGRTKYTFKKVAIKFRGMEALQIKMEKEVYGVRKLLSKSYELLPFTTELGKFWELWQAYRELESNTRDENGTTCLANDGSLDDQDMMFGVQNCTKIIVSGEKFVQEYLDRDKTFLPDGLTVREGTERVQVLDRPSQHIYWRGIRVHDLPEKTPAVLTYNILEDIELTEDRTAKYGFMLDVTIKACLLASEDEVILTKALKASKETFEGSLCYDYQSRAPTPTFTRVAFSPGATGYARSYAESHVPKPPKPDLWKEFPRPWKAGATGFRIYDTNGYFVADAQNAMIMAAILSKVNENLPVVEKEEVIF